MSAVTFPAYFLKRPGDAASIQLELDLLLFARRIAPFFHVRRRFFGTEPDCATTRAYDDGMRRVLPAFGIEPVEIARKEARGVAISASRVRARCAPGRARRRQDVVPEATAAFLRSDEARGVRERLRRRRRKARMTIARKAQAGTIQSSDLMVFVEPAAELVIEIESTVRRQFEHLIRAKIEEVLRSHGVTAGRVRVSDRGALDYAIQARVETALLRGAEE